MPRFFLVIGAVAAGLAVVAGAFGAHLLAQHLTPARLNTFETAVRYQMYHALALLFVGVAIAQWPSWQLSWAGYAFLTGIILFSGSLYGLALAGASWLGPITPLGGVAFITGWALVAWGVLAHEG
jgi:uncharacterized membrane protein YgdD (TMEM256/DUF423 family)